MKVAIIHNYMDNIGGAEKVALTLADELNADILTTNINYNAIKNMGFSNIKIKSIGKVPINAPWRQQKAAFLFRFKKLPKYDLYIIDGDWAMSAAVKNKPNIWYVHSPIREIWDLYDVVRSTKVKKSQRFIFDLWVIFNRWWNRYYIKHVNRLVCNSKNTQKRIAKYLKRNALVINPPIETKKFHYKKNGNFWLSVNRLIDHKRIELQMGAFSKLLKEKLVIVGSYEKATHFDEYINFIKFIKPDNVEIKSFVNDQELIELYANCKGFITTSHNEDFGMTPVEAMAAGKPVVAVNEGGYKETVINGKTGLLVKANVSGISTAIQIISKEPKKYKKECQRRAKLFSREEFIRKINSVIIDLKKNEKG